MFRYSFLITLTIVLLVACAPSSSPESTAQTSPPARPTCVPTRTPDMSTRTPTPTFPGPGTPWPTPKPGTPNFVTMTPMPFAKVTDLAPDLPEDQKTRFIVYRCNGSYELFLGKTPENAKAITATLNLETGDILLYMIPYRLPPKVEPPPPPTAQIEGITLEEARQNFGFHLLEPTYLPSGFRIRYVTHWGLLLSDGIQLDYSGPTPAGKVPAQSFLVITEYFYPNAPTLPSGGPPTPTPQVEPETVRIHGIRAVVDRRFSPPAWFTPEPPRQLYPSLEWWENNLSLTVGGSVSLEELIKIAESLK